MTDLFINKKIIIIIRGVHTVEKVKLDHYTKDWSMYTNLWKTFLVVRELFTIGIDTNCSTLHEFVELGQLARRRFQSHSQFFQLSA